MAIHVYECSNGHSIEMDELANHEFTFLKCNELVQKKPAIRCMLPLRLSAAVRTGTPVLKAGNGGFYSPTRAERDPSA